MWLRTEPCGTPQWIANKFVSGVTKLPDKYICMWVFLNVSSKIEVNTLIPSLLLAHRWYTFILKTVNPYVNSIKVNFVFKPPSTS